MSWPLLSLQVGGEEGVDFRVGLSREMGEENERIVRRGRQPFVCSSRVFRMDGDIFRDRKRCSDSGEFEELLGFCVLG